MSERETRSFEELNAYHDGELRGLARWRFERRLRREPQLRRELAGLERLAGLVRAHETGAAEPDLWDRIEQRLPAIDARRTEAEAGRRAGWSPLLRPLGAVAVAAAALAVVYLGWLPAQPAPGGVVRWMDSGGRPVVVLEGDAKSDVTIIWMLEEAVEGAAQGGLREVA
jgi:anti-sigma-K factor RskA